MFTPQCAPQFTPWRYGPLRVLTVLALLVSAGAANFSSASEELDAETLAFVTSKVRPLLAARCYECHGPDGQRTEEEPAGGLLLASRTAMLEGGDTGPAILPGEPAKSMLIDAVNWGEIEMPPDSKLPEGEIAILTKWVQMGAPWNAGEESIVVAKEAFPMQQRRASHWAWQPLTDPKVSEVADGDWPRRSVDHYVAVAREQKQLGHAPDAERRTLIRRMSFAIIGLPPTTEEVAGFVNDPAADDEAIAALADRLLASPHFGERWGRHWLDLMRYAESRGHEFDLNAANAWHYRDYVIRALNADLPYNDFVVEHLAGDLLDNPRLRDGANESILATGFWYLGDWVHSPTDIRADEMERVDNQLDVFGRAMLGVTIACARCHDHKFDAISSADYYALAGYLQSSTYRQVRFESMEHNRKVAEELWQLRRQTSDRLRHQVARQLQAGTRTSADYLRGAADVIRNQGDAARLATGRKLDRRRLAAWVEHLQSVRDKPDDWLHVWGLLSERPIGQDAFAGVWRSAIQPHRTAAARRAESAESNKLIFDFGNYPQHAWRQDGFAFGPGPVLAGQLLLNGDATNPVVDVALRGAIRQDPYWPALTPARGTQEEAGKAVALKRAGRMLRTPSFTLDKGFYYLARGKGQFQVVVASHRLIHGPLHSSLLKKFDTDGKLKWLHFNCERYVGERAHIEFVPLAGKPFEIYKVVSGSRPLQPPSATSSILLSLAGESGVRSERDLADLVQRKLLVALDKFADGSLSDSKERSAEAALIAWLIDHPALVGETLTDGAVQQALQHFYAQQTEILGKVRRESATAIAMMDGTGEDEYLLIRGSSKKPSRLVPRRFLEALDGQGPPATEAGSGRLELAQQIIDPQRNPLLSRVIVNRVWHHLFGRGIVPSVDNFGVLGQPPSHPELLDHLAQRLIADGWSLKELIRELVTSRTYRMSSRQTAAAADEIDPDNIYLHHMRIKRLEGEAIRDAILAVSGRLDPRIGGAPVPIYLTSHMTGRGRPQSGPLDGAGRRSIYIAIRRNFLSPMMLAFDMPIPFNPVGRRNVSNVPAQPLILMNDPFVVEQSGRWARQAVKKFPEDPSKRIEWMYQTAYSRHPSKTELDAGVEFLKDQAAEYGLKDEAWRADERVWADYAHVLWNVKEFIFVQ